MKIIFYITVSIFLFITCTKRSINESNTDTQPILQDAPTLSSGGQNAVNPLENDTKKPEIDKNLLEGIWAESEDENANFWIKNDSMYFLEDYDNPSYIELRSDTLIANYETFNTIDIILKLTTDSLYLLNEVGDTIKLYKRK
jgi:hypothetical protein